jgi:hypothetical protein
MTTMHAMNHQCAKCGRRQLDQSELEEGTCCPRDESPFSEAEEAELTMELLSLSNEDEVDLFLGHLFKGAWKGLKRVGAGLGNAAGPLASVLKGVAKTALPFAGAAFGSFIPVPGIGTAVGTALGSAVSKALEAEFSGLELEEQEFEKAQRFVRIAGTAAQEVARAAASGPVPAIVRSAVLHAADQHLPHFGDSNLRVDPNQRNEANQHGQWVRRGGQIIIVGV